MPTLNIIEKKLVLNLPSIWEFNQTYNFYKAGHIKNQILTFQAIKVSKNDEPEQSNNKNIANENYIHWGDFVQICHILKESPS